MHRFIALFLCALLVTVASLPTPELNKRVISQSLMDDLGWYVKYASGAYQLLCPIPNGKELVKQVRARYFIQNERIKLTQCFSFIVQYLLDQYAGLRGPR